MLADTLGRPLRFRLTPGQASDVTTAPDLLGRGDERTSKRHYVLASGAITHRAVQSVMLDLRRAAAGYLKSGGRT